MVSRPEVSQRPRRPRRLVRTAAGLALSLLGLGALVVRYVPIPGHAILVANITSPYLIPAAPLAVVLLCWARRWAPAGLAAVLTVALIAVQLPAFVGAAPNPASAGLRVMTINMLYGHADPDAVTAVSNTDADVVMVQELTPAAVRRLTAAGLDATFPHQVLDARPDAAGVGIYSRSPLTDVTRVGGFHLALVTAKVAISGVARDVSLASIHLAAPWPQAIGSWHEDLAAFPGFLDDLASQSGDGTAVVAGDFNSTLDMRPFRALLTGGYQDAAQQAGDGRNLTFPANRPYPPVLGIDHVLTRNATAASTKTVELPNTDHRALLVTVMVPKS